MIKFDLPIERSSEDILNRGCFAQNLAQVLLEYSSAESFSIGLYGKWGSGKTSLLNMVIEKITAANDGTIILRFNPWLCADANQLISQFFKQLATAIRMKQSAKEQAWQLIDQYGDFFEMTNMIPVVGGVLSTGSKLLVKKSREKSREKSRSM